MRVNVLTVVGSFTCKQVQAPSKQAAGYSECKADSAAQQREQGGSSRVQERAIPRVGVGGR